MPRSPYHFPFLMTLAVVLLAAACYQAKPVTSSLPANSTVATNGLTPAPASTPVPGEPSNASPSSVVPATVASPPGGERDGAIGFRAFALDVQAAWDRDDTAFFIQRMKGTDTPCTAADLARKGAEGKPICNAASGTYRGFLAGRWRSEWQTVPLETAFQTLTDISESDQPSAKDAFGSGEMRIHSLNVAPGEYRVVATAIALRPAKRVSVSLTAVFEGGRWQFTSLLDAPVLAEDLLTPGTEFTSRLTALEPFQRSPQPVATANVQPKCPTNTLACKAADDFARYLRFSDFDSLFQNVEATPAVCPGPANVQLGGKGPLCLGASAGELRNGFPITLHGSEGELLSGTDFRLRVQSALGNPTRLKPRAIGCDDSVGCDRFVVVFEIAKTSQPRVIYFVFTARPVFGTATTARLAGLGLSGDNADDILALNSTATGIGATRFFAYAPPQ